MEDYAKVNRANWDAWTAIHAASAFYDVEGFKAGKLSLRQLERDEVGEVAGKSLLHLQCHFGLDTLSWARLGATVTGADFSEPAIALARSLAEEVGLDARFVCADLYDLPAVLHDQFDIVFTSYGVLCWLRDLPRWGAIVAHFLKPGGMFYIAEEHPFPGVFDDVHPPASDGLNFRVAWPYFHTTEPVVEETQGTYTDSATARPNVEYWWSFGLGEVITALAAAGLRLNWVHEFPFHNRRRFPGMVQGADGRWGWPDPRNTLPLLFSLQATKPE